VSDIATTSLKLEASIKDRVRRLADARQRSSHWLMKEAIEQYVDREEKREQFRLDAIKASEEYERTGLHLTGEEVDEWLAKIERGEDAELPEWHR
jgi:predicted transcriptional regulator